MVEGIRADELHGLREVGGLEPVQGDWRVCVRRGINLASERGRLNDWRGRNGQLGAGAIRMLRRNRLHAEAAAA